MAVMAHTEARTSEVYTKGVQRRLLAADGIQALATLDWQGVPQSEIAGHLG